MNDFVCEIRSNEVLRGPYRRIEFCAPELVAEARPGQFVHVRVSERPDLVLRRPFSICSADPATGVLTLVCKIVGKGTALLASKRAGDVCNVLGPLGTSYSTPPDDVLPVAVAGGYGSASTLFLAQKLKRPGVLLAGARTKDDLILFDEYRAAGWSVFAATEDGSEGFRGLVTELLAERLPKWNRPVFLYGCGPAPMLYALAQFANERGIACETSMDQHMGCGVGACFACVVKVKDAASPDGWRYSRSCKEGTVYSAKEVYCG